MRNIVRRTDGQTDRQRVNTKHLIPYRQTIVTSIGSPFSRHLAKLSVPPATKPPFILSRDSSRLVLSVCLSFYLISTPFLSADPFLYL